MIKSKVIILFQNLNKGQYEGKRQMEEVSEYNR